MIGEHELLLREAAKIVKALGKMFAPFCEVVLHDLTRPDHAISAIECNLSGRSVGDSVTELGLARILDSNYPDIVQNYANFFPDGREVKSTSIGIKDGQGKYIAAICLNLDLSIFSALNNSLSRLVSTDDAIELKEDLRANSTEKLVKAISEFATSKNANPSNLTPKDKKQLVRDLHQKGFFQIQNSIPLVVKHLGISRATVYNYLKNNKKAKEQ